MKSRAERVRLAIASRDAPRLERLIGEGADLSIAPRRGERQFMTPLMEAAADGWAEGCAILAAASPAGAWGSAGQHALDLAVSARSEGALRALLAAGGPQGRAGEAALRSAASKAPANLVAALLEAGVDARAPDVFGLDALSRAMGRIEPEAAEACARLLAPLADPKARSERGQGAMWIAAAQGHAGALAAMLPWFAEQANEPGNPKPFASAPLPALAAAKSRKAEAFRVLLAPTRWADRVGETEDGGHLSALGALWRLAEMDASIWPLVDEAACELGAAEPAAARALEVATSRKAQLPRLRAAMEAAEIGAALAGGAGAGSRPRL